MSETPKQIKKDPEMPPLVDNEPKQPTLKRTREEGETQTDKTDQNAKKPKLDPPGGNQSNPDSTLDEKPKDGENKDEKAKDEDIKSKDIKNKKPEYLTYIPWQYLTYNVLKEIIKFDKPFKTPKGAEIVKIIPNYKKFATLCPECPPIKPLNSRVLYTNHPFLCTSFGYSPKETVNETNGNIEVGNQLRYDIENLIDKESEAFVGDEIPTFSDISDEVEREKKVQEYVSNLSGLNAWNLFFMDSVYKNRTLWETLSTLTKFQKKSPSGFREDAPWKSVLRASKSASFGNYLQFKLEIPGGNSKLGLAMDPYSAIIRVYNFDKTFITSKLTKINSTDYEGEDKDVIFDAGMYATGIFTFDHLNFMTSDFGLTMTSKMIRIANKSDLVPESEEGESKPCEI